LPNNQILFVPDRNLGSYVAEHTNKDVILWKGYCYVHENITTDQLKSLKEKYPNAEIIVHPECTIAVRQIADFVGSTSQMSRYVLKSQQMEFIVGTEDNFLYRLKSDNPDKLFYPVNSLCEGMNKITLGTVKSALEKMQYKTYIPKEIKTKAKAALDKMLTIQ